jgi:ergothioneine biosynthesis protein EgtB
MDLGTASGLTRDDGRLADRYRSVRDHSLALAAPLSGEDQQIQSMPDVSPTKWHLAHTTWFFETFLLKPHLAGYQVFDDDYDFLFNSYYEAVGPRAARHERGLISRPSVEEVRAYRGHVDVAMARLLAEPAAKVAALVELGLNHEQQHQELLLMDIKHVLSRNPLLPAYRRAAPRAAAAATTLGWVGFAEGLYEIGHDGQGFAFDNEGPRHRVFLEGFRLADRLVTCAEYRAFIDDGGYRRPELWLSDGWATVRAEGWEAPLYWRRDGRNWKVFTLEGERAANPAEPVCHISHYEADAYARWADARLPTEAEWEVAAAGAGVTFDQAGLHPGQAVGGQGPRQMSGMAWQWTASPYVGYPRYHAAEGAIGEYNGKFMSGQMVLRGSACITPPGHGRITYRNFFPPHARWPFTGLRLAQDA